MGLSQSACKGRGLREGGEGEAQWLAWGLVAVSRWGSVRGWVREAGVLEVQGSRVGVVVSDRRFWTPSLLLLMAVVGALHAAVQMRPRVRLLEDRECKLCTLYRKATINPPPYRDMRAHIAPQAASLSALSPQSGPGHLVRCVTVPEGARDCACE